MGATERTKNAVRFNTKPKAELLDEFQNKKNQIQLKNRTNFNSQHFIYKHPNQRRKNSRTTH